MKNILLLLFLGISFIASAQNFRTIFEISEGQETATYQQTIDFYNRLANKYTEITVQEIGLTDSGKPLHLVIFNIETKNSTAEIKSLGELDLSSKNTILINNGIHPGEPDGIDASMMLLRDIASDEQLRNKFKDIAICIIPIYNIGGSLNRNSHSRANQNGPGSYGFRGNARNYDLNRDFIKNDTKNAQLFSKIFHLIDPDLFIDNHVSNGADYQYTLTHLFTQHNKLGGDSGTFLHEEMMPEIVKDLKDKNLIITPYVNVFNRTPEGGFSQFFDSPRYSTGYTTLFNTFGMMVETHMLKPYKQRVEATYEFMMSTLHFLNDQGGKIKDLRNKTTDKILSGKTYPLQWEIDSSKITTLDFKGYEGSFISSEITGLKRLKYDRSKPYTRPVIYYNYFKPKKEIEIPQAYIIPQGWWNIIELLRINKIKMYPFKNDTVINVESYRIKDYKSVDKPYEGHYLHHSTRVNRSITDHHFKKGDYYIPTQQKGIRYLIETLEPEAQDSFFNWNFFDTILQKKEGFSPYVFEDSALRVLNKDPQLKSDFEKLKREDAKFSKSWYAQLNYIYNRSEYQEKAYLQYPVYRIKKIIF